ncbi:6-phosphogluconate dehydrogenase (decarboxylating) [Geomonas sp. Red276]
MQVGMVGLGRMGSEMARRLMAGGHRVVVFDLYPASVEALVKSGATGVTNLAELVKRLEKPRALWLMLPAAVVGETLASLIPLLEPGDVVVDGGNSHFHDDLRRSARLRERGIHYLDVGTSGGIWGRERGYCLMIGGDPEAVARLEPLFATLAPGESALPRTPGREGEPAAGEKGYLHCGPSGAGHFVKMIHNGIEYGMMASLAEGFNILEQADAGTRPRAADAETAPLRHPEYYRYQFDLPAIAELWRRGSVISSWLLDLSASSLLQSPDLAQFTGSVADSGEGRWTLTAAIDEGAPAHVLSAAVFNRFVSRGQGDFADRLLSAMRAGFGGHAGKPAPADGEAP